MLPVVPLIAPLLAPLSLSLVRYWAEESGEKILRGAGDAEALSDILKRTSEIREGTLPRDMVRFAEELVRLPRMHTFRDIDPLVPADPVPNPKIPTSWLQAKLAELTGMQTVDRGTITRWKDRGVVRQLGRNLIEPQSAAELTTAGQLVIPDLKRGWLEHQRNPNEPYWYCWCQIDPRTPAIPCPYPPPPSLPPYALLWTNWEGAVWNPLFVTIPDLGSIAFAGSELRRGKRRWLVTKEHLRVWDPDMLPLDLGILERADEAFQSAATWTLARLAVLRLSKSVPDLVAQSSLLLR